MATESRLRGKRNPFRRPADYLAVALIVVVSLVTWLVLWQRSDVRNTTLITSSAQVTTPAAPLTFPPSLAEVWEQPSGATAVPVVAGPTIVTADGESVTGRDPLTGQQRWRYTRDLPLCTVAASWGKAVAVYHRSNCNEVTELDQVTGQRDAQRNGDAQLGTRLVGDGIYLTTTGPTLLDTWRSDLVQTDEYGTVPDFVNPNVQPRAGCAYGSVAASPGLVGVVERCPGDPDDRLTVFRSAPKSADTPAVVFSSLTGGKGSRVIAMNDEYTAVVVPGPTHLAVFSTQSGNQIASYPLDLPASDLAGDPPGLVVPVATGTGAVYWYTGSSTISLSSLDFHPQFTIQGTLGAGTVFAGRYLVPVPDALLVLDQATGAKIGSIGVNRNGYTGTVSMATLGPMVFEQRGLVLAALR